MQLEPKEKALLFAYFICLVRLFVYVNNCFISGIDLDVLCVINEYATNDKIPLKFKIFRPLE
jgi:hypothetical protein